MTDDELAAVDEWLDDLETGCDGWYIEVRLVRALRDEVAQTREIVRAVASVPDADYNEECPFCHESPDYLPVKHTADCPVTKARALLNLKP